MDFPFFTEDEQPTMANFNEKFQAMLNYADGKVSAGTYNGKTSVSNSMSSTVTLTFPFQAKTVIIMANRSTRIPNDSFSYYAKGLVLCVGDVAMEFTSGYNDLTIYSNINVTRDGNAVSFVVNQSDITGTTYYYVGIG